MTGETRGPPPKPKWLVDLQEKGAVVELEIRPLAQKSAAATASSSAGTIGRKSTKVGAGDGKDGVTVTVEGNVVKVEGEKESLTSLGREELQDDRVSRMAVLTR